MTPQPQPLKLLSGMLIDVITGEVVSDPNEEQSVSSVTEDDDDTDMPRAPKTVITRKRLAELPDTIAVMNAVGVVLMYELWGLPPSEIAAALSAPLSKIELIQDSDAYIETKREVTANLIESMQDDVRGKLAAHATVAVDKMLGMMKNSKSEDTRLTVAQDVLDRAGFSPQAVVNHKHSFEDELVMRVIRDDRTASGDKTLDLKVITDG